MKEKRSAIFIAEWQWKCWVANTKIYDSAKTTVKMKLTVSKANIRKEKRHDKYQDSRKEIKIWVEVNKTQGVSSNIKILQRTQSVYPFKC